VQLKPLYTLRFRVGSGEVRWPNLPPEQVKRIDVELIDLSEVFWEAPAD
jgi:hypothetical protein